ncbi:MAG: polyprenyl synthetase family protein [Deltaproteobacteria bacterium]|nr:polyprenyl synthetase family protein [Deltaproteobacteria bacterium]
MVFQLEQYMKERKEWIEGALRRFIPFEKESKGAFSQLYFAMEYALFPGGQRFRPILTLASAAAVGGNEELALPSACAIEMVHNYSLVHDDLPAIDDDSIRRGKTAVHLEYGDAMAILCGDALLSDAFYLLSEVNGKEGLSPDICCRIISLFSRAAGSLGMVGGQSMDVAAKGHASVDWEFPELEFMSIHKTGDLIRVAAMTGGLVGNGKPHQIELLSRYGQNLGLAYQIVDDLIDRDTFTPSFPSLIGVTESRERVQSLIEGAVQAAEELGQRALPLRELALYVLNRMDRAEPPSE